MYKITRYKEHCVVRYADGDHQILGIEDVSENLKTTILTDFLYKTLQEALRIASDDGAAGKRLKRVVSSIQEEFRQSV